MKNIFRFLLYTLGLIFLVGCSTENNTLINRSYHTMCAKYNGNFNANELLKQSLDDYRNNLKEDYYKPLEIELYPNEEEVKSLYTPIDTAISKCTKVIQKHCMPSNDKPSKKTVEWNNYIDENWITLGKADFYRRDYDAAMKKFSFVKKFFTNDPSMYISDLWIAKVNIAKGNISEASANIKGLELAIKEQKEREAAAKELAKQNKKKVKKQVGNKKDIPAEVPKAIFFPLEITKAQLALKKNEKEEAIKNLTESLKYAKKQADKARICYILGQLYEEQGQRGFASQYYNQVLKYNTKYEMAFNARLKRAALGGGAKFEKDLKKMLRDAKNAEYKDQILYALAEIEINKNNIELAKEYLTKSTFYSTTNKRQKAMSYEKLGDLAFKERKYVIAQKNYKECANIIDDEYPNAKGIRNKAEKLANLVVAVETANREDSLMRVAQMPENEREDFIKYVIKKTKEEEAKRKKEEAEKLRELQQNALIVSDNGNGSKWYFTNPKARTEGFEEFKKVWGQRENEDDWRRSDKIVLAINIKINENGDTLEVAEPEEPIDTLTVEYLTAKLPLTDSAFQASMQNSIKNHYDAGVIYKDQLFENNIAAKEFNLVIDRNKSDNYNLLSAFQLYRMYEKQDEAKSNEHKNYILNHYPNSDYANFLRDPDFFMKKKELDALAEKEYVTNLDRYDRRLYGPVLAKADLVIEGEKDNKYRSKYMLLKAMALGQTNNDKTVLTPVLEQIIKEYPKTKEAEKATEMLKIMKDGYSKNETIDFKKASLYNFSDEVKQWVIIFVDSNETSSTAKNKVSDFNREFYSREKLEVSSKLYGEESIVVVQAFENDIKAKEYVRFFKSTKKHLGNINKSKVMIITQENMKKLYETQKLKEYEDFYNEYY